MSSLMVFNNGYIVINIDIVWLQKTIIPTKLWTQAILKLLEECTKLQIANFSVDKFFKSARMKRIPLWKQNAGGRRLRRFIAQVSLRFSGDFWACDMHVHVIMYMNYFTVKLKNSSLAKATLTFYIQWFYCACQGDIMKITYENPFTKFNRFLEWLGTSLIEWLWGWFSLPVYLEESCHLKLHDL